MSETVFSQLPRFDMAGGVRPADWLRALNAGEQPAPPAKAAAEETVPAPAPQPVKAEPAVVKPVPQETAALQASVSGLARLMERIDAESRQHTVETVRLIAGQLFPELSRKFLAEEIGKHLPGLIPAAAAIVDISAEPALAGQLREMISHHPALEGRCNVIATEGKAHGRAEVSWRTGGVTFDFEGLLSACLDDLGTTHKSTTE